ncbi:hypothetical protein ACLB2K_006126 [Fragaria x ananassa]
MEILSWNFRGLNNDRAVEALQTLIRQKKPSFIFLSKTKVHDIDYMNNLRLKLGNRNCEVVYSDGQSGGVALFWEDGMDVRFLLKSNFHVDVEVYAVDGSGMRWRLTGFYGHPAAVERWRSWERLRRLAEVSSLPWIVVGDFNEIVSNTEKKGGVSRCGRQMLNFSEALYDAELIDAWFIGAPFTWQGGGVWCRLDRVVANPSWFDTFPAARPRRVPFKYRFRFESSWTNLEACKALIEEEWASTQNGVPMHQMVQKITKTRMALNVWQCSTFGNRKREIELIRYRLEELFHLPLSDVHRSEYAELSSKLEVLLEEEHAYWKQRAKVQWLSDGDKNTKFFHRKASNRRAKNRLQGLFDNGGVRQLATEGMETVIVNYFQSMYASATLDENHMYSIVDLLQPRVTTNMNGELCAEYSDDEIRAALFQMYPTVTRARWNAA